MNNNKDRVKGGRPKGTTDAMKKAIADKLIAAKNEIAVRYKKVKDESENKPVSNGTLNKIIEYVKKEKKIPHDTVIKADTIRRRISRMRPHVLSSGGISPLISIEDSVVQIIIQMARIRQSLTPSKGLQLVNDMIHNTPLQTDLIKWKEKHTSNATGTLGRKYWKNFMRRHKDKIKSKRGAKYSLDRANWSTYTNFNDMYEHNYEEMEMAGVAVRLDEPVWKDRSGNIVEEADALGCKVTHDLIHPEMCIVGDEVGGNLNMDGDGHVGGTKLLCAKDAIPQKKTSTRDKHFTLLPLMLLTGEPLMCILIIAGKKPDALVEMGINHTAEMNGEEGDEDFFEKNSGPAKLYPGGPTCTVRGIDVPCFIRWSENGSITATILTEALMELDHLKVLPRVNGVKPYLLVDGHGSRFGLNFLSYINNPDHEWVVCIGTPYGTALWQVGDSKECNGSFNIAITKAKQNLLDEKSQQCVNAQLQTYDIIPLVNAAWKQSFARIEKNKNACADRGWNPLNRCLLLHSEIRATMTDEEQDMELSSTSSAIVPYSATTIGTNTSAIVPYRAVPTATNTISTTPPTTLTIPPPLPTLNFEYGNAAYCLDSIVSHDALQKARQRIRKEQEKGESLKHKISVSKRVTAGILVKAGSHRIGQTVFDVVKQRTQEKAEESRRKIAKAKATYTNDVAKADTILSSKPPQADKSANPTWTIKELQAILKPMKRKDDGAMPKKKPPLLALYHKFLAENRERATVIFDAGSTDEIMRECTDLVAVVNDVDVDVNDAADEDDDGFFQATEI